jgi:hypothetical protein
LRRYPDASFTDVVAPNADTLYEIGWFDLAKEPIIIHPPALNKRYALFSMLDAWTNVFSSPGTLTTGDAAQTLAFTGPKWHGNLPSGVREVKSPTTLVWIIGRVYSDGTTADLDLVHKLQDSMTTGTRFFALFASLLVANPPAAADAPMVAKLAQLGIIPGKPLDAAKLDPTITVAMNAAPKTALSRMQAYFPDAGTVTNGWMVSTKLGSYGTNYTLRAFVALIGLGANLPEDAVYPATVKPLDGTNNYVMHFAKSMTPPAQAFWSITLYNKDQFFYGNPLNRYNVSSRTPFVANADGSTDVYIQHASPGQAKEANWLPSPADKFSLIMRLYLPVKTPPSILDGSWKPPAVTPAP